MPIKLSAGASTLLIRRTAFEASGTSRADIDTALGLTADEFAVEADLVVVGPIYDSEALAGVVASLESRGVAFFDDMFELSGNWPDWLTLFAMSRPSGAAG